MIVGGGGRESAFALNLAQNSVVCAVMDHPNPTIINCAKRTGGEYLVAPSSDPETLLDFARKTRPDYVFVNADAPLANGAVDALLENNFKTIGGTKEASRIEWDKIYSIELVGKTCPEFTPFYRVARRPEELDGILAEFGERRMGVAVKPQGLTGGKGVKVMPQHLASYAECRDYAAKLLRANPGESVLLAEKLEGAEFTVMGFTDGEHLAPAPATYDYPFRYDGDTGPGTGGMGCFTAPEKKLPFMDEQDWRDCIAVMQRVVDEMKARGHRFSGVLNGGFFKTAQGIRFMEFNGRFGDPEALNILMVLERPLSELLASIWNKTLREDNVRFTGKASVVKYLTSPEYPLSGGKSAPFAVAEEAVRALGINIFCASCAQNGGEYETLNKPSRVIALGCVADKIETAAAQIDRAIENHITGGLEYRKDIGAKHYLESLITRFGNKTNNNPAR